MWCGEFIATTFIVFGHVSDELQTLKCAVGVYKHQGRNLKKNFCEEAYREVLQIYKLTKIILHSNVAAAAASVLPKGSEAKDGINNTSMTEAKKSEEEEGAATVEEEDVTGLYNERINVRLYKK
jgi:hypothetical protein